MNCRQNTPAFFIAGYNFYMHNFRHAGLILLGFATIILASTYLEKRETTAIPFSTPSGYSGSIVLDMPVRVIAGDKTKLKARVSIAGSDASLTALALAGRLEAGFEELSPAGRVSVNLDNGSAVELVWGLRTTTGAIYPGNLWLWLISGSGEDLLMVRELSLESRSYFGLRVVHVRVGNIVFMLVSLLMLAFVMLMRPRKQTRL